MLPNLTNDTNIPIPSAGVHNEFASAITSGEAPKKDSIKIIMVIILIVTILLAVAAFLYTDLLSSEINNKKLKLSSFDSSANMVTFGDNLDNMRSLSQKLKLLNSVYDNKMYISSMLFPILENIVESDYGSYVYFNKFNLKKQESLSLASVSLSGIAKDYVSLYRQLDSFKTGPMSPSFSNFKLLSLSLDQNGNVLFDISFDIDISTKTFLNYINGTINNITNSSSTNSTTKTGPLFKGQQPANVIPVTPTTTTSSSSEILTN